MAGDRNEEEVGLIGILGAELALSNVLEEISLAGVLPGELPRRLVESVRISVGIYIHLEFPFHLGVVQPEHLRRVERVGNLVILLYLSRMLHFNLRRELRSGWARVLERGVEGFEGETDEGD